MLTSSQLENISRIKELQRMYIADEPRANSYGNGNWREFSDLNGKRVKLAKDLLKIIIQEWLGSKDVKAVIRLESFSLKEYRSNKIKCDAVGLTNGVGSIKGGNNNYLNKVYVSTGYIQGSFRVRTHKVRTDPSMLHPFEEEFLEFFTEIMEKLNG